MTACQKTLWQKTVCQMTLCHFTAQPPKVGAGQQMNAVHQINKQNMVIKNQKLVFINQKQTAS